MPRAAQGHGEVFIHTLGQYLVLGTGLCVNRSVFVGKCRIPLEIQNLTEIQIPHCIQPLLSSHGRHPVVLKVSRNIFPSTYLMGSRNKG